MSEYAVYEDKLVKLATGSYFHYIRYEDRLKVKPQIDNINCTKKLNLYWRLPYPDEDNIKIGEYQDPNRVYPLHGFAVEGSDRHAGMLQLYHESGLIINVVCHHGIKLPKGSREMQAFWNRKAPFYALCAVKNTPAGLKAVVKCQFCGRAWKTGIDNVLQFIYDKELKRRLSTYQTQCLSL
jgi:hypothetical protein